MAAERTLGHTLAAQGLDDDFMHQWPALVEAALDAGDLDAADRLAHPVATAEPGRVPPVVAAQLLWLRGRIGAARGADEDGVESDLRAGVEAFADFGAVPRAARAAEDTGLWLLGRGRIDDAAPLLDQARTTYLAIGADGWLARLDERLAADVLAT